MSCRLPAVVALLIASGCSAPERLAFHRFGPAHVSMGLLTPEARPAPVPLALSMSDSAAAPAVDGAQVARTAESFLGKRVVFAAGKRFPDDCTGLVRAVYAAHGIDLFSDGGAAGDNGVTAIWRYTSRHGVLLERDPAPGDLVFFRETYDRNRDGRLNDGLTHIGIVEAVEPDGTVQVIHRVAKGVVRYHMNVAKPHELRDAGGRVLNDYLRESGKLRTAGELFAGYGRIVK